MSSGGKKKRTARERSNPKSCWKTKLGRVPCKKKQYQSENEVEIVVNIHQIGITNHFGTLGFGPHRGRGPNETAMRVTESCTVPVCNERRSSPTYQTATYSDYPCWKREARAQEGKNRAVSGVEPARFKIGFGTPAACRTRKHILAVHTHKTAGAHNRARVFVQSCRTCHV